MKALQLHYTSCRRGQSGNAGFQTRALSQGIRSDEQREIERRGVYRPPRNARQDPAPGEIVQNFPIAFRSYILESGRPAITRAVYVGRDYSGRWGNFFAHSLVFENGQISTLWPIDLYEWPGWREGLSSTEDSEETPPPLPLADLAGVPPAESFRFKELRDFLREDSGRCELLAKMGRAVFLGRASSRALVIRDTPLHGLYWIACLQKIFSPQHAAALTFSTYQDDPRGCAAINATTGETDFTFDESERRFRFYEFDLTTGTHSEVPEATDDYPAIAARWMAEDPAKLQQLYQFLHLFDHREPEAALVSAVHLFDLAQGTEPAPGGDQLTGMIDFASRHATVEGRVRLLEVLGRASDLAGGLPQAEDYDPLIRFLSAGARETGRPEHRALAFRAWISLLHHHLLAVGNGQATAEATWEHLQTELGPHVSELAALVLAHRPDTPQLVALPLPVLAFLLRVTWSCLVLQRSLPTWEQPEVIALLSAVAQLKSDAALAALAVLLVVPNEAEPLLAVSRRLRDTWVETGQDRRKVSLGVGRALGRRLTRMDLHAATTLRRRLEEQKDWDLLYGEWLDFAERTEDTLAAFTSYRSSIFASHPHYEQACLAWVAKSLLHRLPADRLPGVALDWLRHGEIDRFPDDLATTCIQHAATAVSLDPEDRGAEEAARLVADAAAKRKLALRPDRPLLRHLRERARASKIKLRDLRLEELRENLSRLPIQEHEAFLDDVLVPLLDQGESKSDHEHILHAAAGERPAVLRNSYLKFFKTQRKVTWPGSLQAALRFWLGFEPRGTEGSGILSGLQEEGQKGLLLALERLKPEELQRIESNLGRARIDRRARERWDEMRASAETRQRSPLRRVLGFFGR
jgi:hypothetical protein